MLSAPNFTLRNAMARMMAIRPSAMKAPMIELLMLRSEMCENIRLVEAGTVHIVLGRVGAKPGVRIGLGAPACEPR